MNTTARDIPSQPAWRKSTFSGGGTGSDCVELAEVDGEIMVRDSKDPSGTVLRFTRSEARAFIQGAKAGEFDDLLL